MDGAEVVEKWKEMKVALGSQLSLTRTNSKVYLSSPSIQEVLSHKGLHYVGVGPILL